MYAMHVSIPIFYYVVYETTKKMSFKNDFLQN